MINFPYITNLLFWTPPFLCTVGLSHPSCMSTAIHSRYPTPITIWVPTHHERLCPSKWTHSSLWLLILPLELLHGYAFPSSWVSKPYVRLPFHVYWLSSHHAWTLTCYPGLSPFRDAAAPLHWNSDTHIRLPLCMGTVLILAGLWHQCRSTHPNECLLPTFWVPIPWSGPLWLPSISSVETSLFLPHLKALGLQEGKRKKKLGRGNIAFLNS